MPLMLLLPECRSWSLIADDAGHLRISNWHSSSGASAPPSGKVGVTNTVLPEPTCELLKQLAEMPFAGRLALAERARGSKIKTLREAAKCPTRGKAFRSVLPAECMVNCKKLMQACLGVFNLCLLRVTLSLYQQALLMCVPCKDWFVARKLDGILQEQTRDDIPDSMKNDHWRYFALKPFDGADEIPDDWAQAFHGTWFPTLWNILYTQSISPSTDLDLGHEFNKLGPKVYVTPKLATAISYARPQDLFGDGMFHRCILELRVPFANVYKRKAAGGTQWTFDADLIRIVGVWITSNCGNLKGYDFLRCWNSEEEVLPEGITQAGTDDIDRSNEFLFGGHV